MMVEPATAANQKLEIRIHKIRETLARKSGIANQRFEEFKWRTNSASQPEEMLATAAD